MNTQAHVHVFIKDEDVHNAKSHTVIAKSYYEKLLHIFTRIQLVMQLHYI